jgi:hypothetical protein
MIDEPRLLDGLTRLLTATENNIRQRCDDDPTVSQPLQGRYEAVVGNPPYINVQDPELRQLYRRYYESCSGTYQVSIPFTELLFGLAERNGFVAVITSNAFMKRSFGKKLIEEYVPKWDVTHIIDTSGVYLPGHGTPTTILMGRHRAPVAGMLRVVRGIRGEATLPDDPPNAPVWRQIRDNLHNAGFSGQYVSVVDAERQTFHVHPWSIGGGGASELKNRLDQVTGEIAASNVGRTVVLGEEDVWLLGTSRAHSDELSRPLVSGGLVREWQLGAEPAIYPYTSLGGSVVSELPMKTHRRLWSYRRLLQGRSVFGKSMEVMGRPWYELLEHYRSKFNSPYSIAFGEIATHNHFVLDRGGKLFTQTAPVIKLGATDGEPAHLGLLGVLNSSTACFWLRQVCRNKGMHGESGGLKSEYWEQFFAFNPTNVSQMPLPASRPLELAAATQSTVEERAERLPAALIAREVSTRASLDVARERADALLLRMIALQEELDWQVYHLYGLLEQSLTLPIDQIPPVHLGERAFEIFMARAMESGELQTEWFARHRSTPRTTIPEHWPEPYRALVQRRLDTIACAHDIALIEQPEYKRRWNLPPWEKLEEDALRNWLLDRLEDPRYWPMNPSALTSVARLADAVRHDADFLQVAELFRHRADFDLPELIEELVTKESVPFLPVLRYKESGLRKRADWERTWQLQRREDSGEKVEIPVPPKYEKDDFLSADYWRLRGKLDVPKERFIAYSPLSRDADKSLVIAWACYHHGQQALALASYCYEMRGMEAWPAERLTPILAGLLELQPWLDQWHNEIDPERQQRLNEFIRAFVEAELAQLSLSAEQVRAWRPSAQAARANRRKKR